MPHMQDIWTYPTHIFPVLWKIFIMGLLRVIQIHKNGLMGQASRKDREEQFGLKTSICQI
jgi:hypothetical protein